VAECPFADLRKTAEYRLGHMLNVPDLVTRIVVESGMLYARLADGFDFSKVSPLRSIETTATPILLIHGLADTRTPPTDSRQLARANPQNQLWLVPNAEHTGAAAAAPEEFRNRVLSWFGTTDTCGVYH
jgi:pimeloyl-ACP methyl ester carboxylesterase